MTDIVLVRQDTMPISKTDADAARRVLFGAIDGLSVEHKKSWRRLWNWFMTRAEPGEMLEMHTHKERLGWFHRKHMAMEQRVFQAQERFARFYDFRTWLKVGAGHVDWFPGPKGGVIPVPKSISYSQMEQQDMELFHDAAIDFLRTEHAQKTLWPTANALDRSNALDALLAEFGELAPDVGASAPVAPKPRGAA